MTCNLIVILEGDGLELASDAQGSLRRPLDSWGFNASRSESQRQATHDSFGARLVRLRRFPSLRLSA